MKLTNKDRSLVIDVLDSISDLTFYDRITVEEAIVTGSLWKRLEIDFDDLHDSWEIENKRLWLAQLSVALVIADARGWKFKWYIDRYYGDSVELVDQQGNMVDKGFNIGEHNPSENERKSSEANLAFRAIR